MRPMVALIMAAGAASRFGSCKATADIGGVTPLQKMVEILNAAGIDDIRVISGAWHQHIADAMPANASLYFNPRWQEGLGRSIAFGVSTVHDGEGILIVLADQIGLQLSDIAHLLESFNSHQSVCAYYCEKRGVPAIFAPQHWPVLQQLSGDTGAKHLLQDDTSIIAVDLPNAAYDLDTQQQLETFRAQQRRG